MLRLEGHQVQHTRLKTEPISKLDPALKLELAVAISYFTVEIKFYNMTVHFFCFINLEGME